MGRSSLGASCVRRRMFRCSSTAHSRSARSRSTRPPRTSTRSADRNGSAVPTRPARSTCATLTACARGWSRTRAPRPTTSPRAPGSRKRAHAASTPPSPRRRRSPVSKLRSATLPDGRFARARELAERCRALLVERGHEVVSDAGQGTLVSFRFAGDTAEAATALYERGVIVRELPGTGLLRASVGWWNDESDLHRLVEALGRS